MNQGFGDNSLGEYSTTSILLYSFLENTPNCIFLSELNDLGNQLKSGFRFEGLSDGDLQTDGNRSGRFQPVSGDEEETFRIIGAQLAEIGDQLSLEIEPSFINTLVQQFTAENFSREEITRHLSQAVQTLVRRIPGEMDRDKAMLVIVMVLAQKVASTVPSFLHRVFLTTVNYINYNLRDVVDNLAPES